ncbi:MAG: thioredoxin fold domain-containing protein, partial [Gammaproteobacteria bacterium]
AMKRTGVGPVRMPGVSVARGVAGWLLAVMLLTGCDSKPPVPAVAEPEMQAAVHEASTANPPVAELAAGMVNPGYEDKPEWFANSFLDIREDIAEAQAQGKRVLLYFYQDGCPYCKKLLDTNFALADTVQRTRDNFDVIAINMWGDREVTDLAGMHTTEKEFAKQLRVMFTPTLLFLDEQGRIVLRLNGYYPPHKFNAALDYGAQYSGDAPDFRGYLAQVDPAPASGKLYTDASFLSAATDLAARDSGKPLLVLFEQADCAPCDELHQDILQRPASRVQLARFDVVLLDMWSNAPVSRTDGRKSSIAEWARDLKVQYAPSLLFFDADNREVFRTEAYLKAFHTQSAMDYVASRAYLEQPDFQRYIAARADALEARGIHVDLME